MKLNARQLRECNEVDVKEKIINHKSFPIYLILENIYDTYNVGGLFRLADAIKSEKIYLCGQTEIPPNAKIKKASIGTYKIVPWQYCKSVKEAIDSINSKLKTLNTKQFQNQNDPKSKSLENLNLKNSDLFRISDLGFRVSVIAVEQSPKSISYTKANYSFPIALVVGNETYGVLPETLELADQIVEIPMWGINKSLNVIVSAAIVSFHVMEKMIK